MKTGTNIALWREPLLQFGLLGGCFALLWQFAGPASEQALIRVTPVQRDQIRQELGRRLGRTPTDAEATAEVSAQAEDEMLVREARRLGLDRDDTIVRRRLIQKMEFLGQWQATSIVPDEPTLLAYYAAHLTRYTEPERTSLRHAYWSHDRHGTDGALQQAARWAATAGPQQSGGEAFAAGEAFTLRSVPQLQRVFGLAFAADITTMPMAQWSQPVESAYGWHSVWISAREPSTVPALAAVHDAVLADWLTAQREQARSHALQQIRARYRVESEP